MSPGSTEQLTAGQRVSLWLVIVVPALVRSIGIDDNLLGPSEWREVETATLARNFLDGPNIFYPRVNWGAPGPGYVECEFQLFSYIVSLGYRLFGVQPWLGRLLAVLLAAACTWAVYRLARRWFDAWPAILSALAFASSPLVFRFGRSFMPEALALLCYVCSARVFLRWLDSGRLRTAGVAGGWLALAILVKPTSIHLGLWCVMAAVSRRGWRSLWSRPMLLFGSVALAPVAAYYAHAASLHRVYGNSFGVISGGDSKWGSWEQWSDPALYGRLLSFDVYYGMGYAGTALVVLGLLFARCGLRGHLLRWLAVLVVYYLIVARYAGHESRGLHYHVYAVVPLALALAAGAQSARRIVATALPNNRWLPWFFVLVPVFGMGLQQWRSNARLLQMPREDVYLRAGQALAAISTRADLVLVTSGDVAFDRGTVNNHEDPKVMFHAWRRGRQLPRDELTAARLQREQAICSARYLVVLEHVLADAEADFGAKIAGMPLVVEGEGFRILELPRD